jgi:hypothetical protein
MLTDLHRDDPEAGSDGIKVEDRRRVTAGDAVPQQPPQDDAARGDATARIDDMREARVARRSRVHVPILAVAAAVAAIWWWQASVPAETMSNVWQLMFGLQDPLGRLVNQAILVLFFAAVIDLTVAAFRIRQNSHWLSVAQDAFGELESPVAEAATRGRFMLALGLTRAAEDSLVAQRVRNLFRLRARRVLDVGVLKEISGENVSLHGGFSRFVAGTLTVLGLVGTVLGLTLAIDKLPALAASVKSSGEITAFLDQVLQTLGGMHTAFSCTLTGLVSSVVLSVLNYGVQRAQASFFLRLETFANSELVPAIVPAPADHASEEFVRRLDDAGPRLLQIVERIDNAALVFAEGMQTLAASTTKVDESVVRLSTRMDDAVVRLAAKMDALTVSADAFKAGAETFDDVRNLPQSLQQVLQEAMRGAVAAVREPQEAFARDSVARQDRASTEYLARVDLFFKQTAESHHQLQQSYADLLVGVQHGVGELLARFADRHDEMLRALRNIETRLAQTPRGAPAAFGGRTARDGGLFWRRSHQAEPPASADGDGRAPRTPAAAPHPPQEETRP